MSDQIDNEVARLRNLQQYKDSDEKYLRKVAGQNIQKRELGFEKLFSDKDDVKNSIELFVRYIEDYSFESESDFNNLKSLVYNETILLKLQQTLDKITNEKDFIPDKQIKAVVELQKQINTQKKELGLIKEDDGQAPYKVYAETLKKFKVYQLEHPDEFYSRCPECQEMIKWNFRVEHYKPSKVSLLKNNRPWNDTVKKLVQKNRLTIKEASEILDTSETYIEKILMRDD